MAHRLLLTLLALITGLVAQVGPAEARGVPVAAAQVVMLGESAKTRPSRAPVALARLPEPGLRTARAYAPPLAPGGIVLFAAVLPGFRIGADRALI